MNDRKGSRDGGEWSPDCAYGSGVVQQGEFLANDAEPSTLPCRHAIRSHRYVLPSSSFHDRHHLPARHQPVFGSRPPPARPPGDTGTRAYRLLHVVIPPGSNVAPPVAALTGTTGRRHIPSHLDAARRFPAFPRTLTFRTDRNAPTFCQGTTTSCPWILGTLKVCYT